MKLKELLWGTQMEEDNLLPLLREQIPQPPSEKVSICLTPNELKDIIIFGSYPSSPKDSSIKICSPSSSSFLEGISPASPPLPPLQQPWLVDFNYHGRRISLRKSKTAPAMAGLNDFNQDKANEEPQPRFQSVVLQAFVLLWIYLSIGVMIYLFNRRHFTVRETHPIIDALYFCIVTMCTIGYGDITPNSTTTKLFSIMFVLVGFGFIHILLSGMVTYALDLQENHLLNMVKAKKQEDQKKSMLIDVKKGRMRIRMKVALALGVVVLCIGVGVAVMHYVEKLGWVDSLYLSVMSVTTVGYGDRAFTTMYGRGFACGWLLVSTLAVARAFLYLAEARIDKRNRLLAKRVLGQDMTVSQFLAADIDNNGFVSKSEYVIYKLKEMGKVSDKDILLICKKFDQLEAGKRGKITLSDLVNGHHSDSLSLLYIGRGEVMVST